MEGINTPMVAETFVHSHALVDPGAIIGGGTRVWAFAHVLGGAVIGEECNVCDHTFIEGKVRVGNRVTIKCGVYLWDGLVVEDDVFIGPSAVFTNDLRPRSKSYPVKFPVTLLKRGCSIGAGSVVLPGVTIGSWAMVAAGSVVTRNVADFALVVGCPARQRGAVCKCGQRLDVAQTMTSVCVCGLSYRKGKDGRVSVLA